MLDCPNGAVTVGDPLVLQTTGNRTIRLMGPLGNVLLL